MQVSKGIASIEWMYLISIIFPVGNVNFVPHIKPILINHL